MGDLKVTVGLSGEGKVGVTLELDCKEPEGLQGRVGKLDDQQWSAWCASAAWQQTEPRLVAVGLERKAPGAKHAQGA